MKEQNLYNHKNPPYDEVGFPFVCNNPIFLKTIVWLILPK